MHTMAAETGERTVVEQGVTRNEIINIQDFNFLLFLRRGMQNNIYNTFIIVTLFISEVLEKGRAENMKGVDHLW